MNDRVRRVQGLRSSSAAGPHGSRPARAAETSAALADWGIGAGDCVECGHPFDSADSIDPEVCPDCETFAGRSTA